MSSCVRRARSVDRSSRARRRRAAAPRLRPLRRENAKGACEWARDLARRQRPRQPLPADSTVVVWQSRAPGVAGGRYRLTSWIGTRGRTGANEYGRPSEASAACESRRGVAEGPSGTGASQRSRAVELRSRMAREPPRGPGSLSSTNRRADRYLLGVVGQTGICPASGTLVEGNRKEPSGPGCPHRGPGPLSSGNRRVLKHVNAVVARKRARARTDTSCRLLNQPSIG